ncbi:hypothetical protein AMTR_s00014p00104370 [Amborella trichopoda]|uniref:Uncharacterized protein n=1 Tax=Amborella trichopoda TaxID=13333 RepID=W1PN19_AMBTC|nr:hypothetical protein AMTR_s00014p00104370 [Amborella trichopoda]
MERKEEDAVRWVLEGESGKLQVAEIGVENQRGKGGSREEKGAAAEAGRRLLRIGGERLREQQVVGSNKGCKGWSNKVEEMEKKKGGKLRKQVAMVEDALKQEEWKVEQGLWPEEEETAAIAACV